MLCARNAEIVKTRCQPQLLVQAITPRHSCQCYSHTRCRKTQCGITFLAILWADTEHYFQIIIAFLWQWMPIRRVNLQVYIRVISVG